MTQERTKSERSIEDNQATMGIGCTRVNDRVAAAFGELANGAEPKFASNESVSMAGVLFAVPALLSNGLLDIKNNGFSLPKGYYQIQSIFLILGFMALLRIKKLESLRYQDPGEMGKLVGLDRVPEVRTLRKKIELISQGGDPKAWNLYLSDKWLKAEPDLAGELYIDGHVRLYYGKQTNLPKKFVSRQKLCLKGVMDYWVNDAIGQPFFVIHKEINPGLLSVLRDDIVPQLLQDVPNQPTQSQLDEDSNLHRFGLVFDREGYSPDFFEEMWKKYRITCTTYRKYQKEDWPKNEFSDEMVSFPNGNKIEMKLAVRNEIKIGAQKFCVREIRKLTESAHQTAIITTNRKDHFTEISAHMFSRWTQENFFKYMRQEYDIDGLTSYRFEQIDETVTVKNPAYTKLEKQIRSIAAKYGRAKVELAEKILEDDIEEENIQYFLQKNAELSEKVENYKDQINNLKTEKKELESHIKFSDLLPEEKFKALPSNRKFLIDTIKMVAYRSETVLANILIPHLSKPDEARSIIKQILKTDADIIPDEKNQKLYVNLHSLTNPVHRKYASILCEYLNDTLTIFPDTDYVLVYDLVSNKNLLNQEL